MRIGFLSAFREERLALRKAWPVVDSGTLRGLPLDTGERAVSVCSGVGAERMLRAVRMTQEVFQPQLMILVGFSAGLRADLSVGEVVCDERGDASLLAALREFPLPLRFGTTVTCDFLNSASEKSALAERESDALVADLESEVFMEACGGVPHLVLRVISDDLHTDLPLPFEEFLNARGFPDDMAIARELIRRPKLAPALWELAKDATLAQRALTSVVRDIRPLLVRRLMELS